MLIAKGVTPIAAENCDIIQTVDDIKIETTDVNQIFTAIKKDFEEIRASGYGVSKYEAHLIISSSKVPNCDLVDLPGLLVVPQDENEPNTLPAVVTELVSTYLRVPNCIVLAMVNANAKERQSPSVALLRKIPPTFLIKCLSMPDLALRFDHTNPTHILMDQLKGINTLLKADIVVCVKNNFNGTFDEQADHEMKFFNKHFTVDEMKELDCKLGIKALLQHISDLSEKVNRDEFKTNVSTNYQQQLKHYVNEEIKLGAVLTSSDIAAIVVRELFSTKKLNELFDKVWKECHYIIPLKVFDKRGKLDYNTYCNHFKSIMIQSFNKLFDDQTNYMLHRFKVFQFELIQFFSERFDILLPQILQSWQHIQNYLNNSFMTVVSYKPEMWQHGTANCLIQDFFLQLMEVKEETNLQQMLEMILTTFSCLEDNATTETRQHIQDKIIAIQNILKKL